MFRVKKGAMFGLDARIALAIFGALSVISGAALYSAIQSARMTAKVEEINQLEMAIEQYMLDTGEQLPKSISTTVFIGNLYNNYASYSNWKGPYYGSGSTSETYLKTKITNTTNSINYCSMTKAGSADWNASITGAMAPCTASDCYLYFNTYTNTGWDDFDEFKTLVDNLDQYVDGGDGFHTGKVRVRQIASTYKLYYKLSIPYRN